MRNLLILLGLALLTAGLAWPWLERFPAGRLPGDIVIERDGFRLYLPFTTMALLSLLVSLIAWWFRR